jgi:hypothetical protein
MYIYVTRLLSCFTSLHLLCPSTNSPGGSYYFGATANLGIVDCPTGTQNTGSTTAVGIGNCDRLVTGYYYKAPGPISSATIVQCDPGFWCDTNNVPMVVNTTTPVSTGIGGRNPCPVGSSSFQFARLITHCNRLLAGFEFAGGADISMMTIQSCNDERYCAGERTIIGTTPLLGTACPEGTGVNKQANDDDPGASSPNDCTKLYQGYYYTGAFCV